jgi:hypothetical protein
MHVTKAAVVLFQRNTQKKRRMEIGTGIGCSKSGISDGELVFGFGGISVPMFGIIGTDRRQGGIAMPASTDTKELKSPLRKLVQFFRRSRDRWKQKYQELKLRCKRLATQVAAVERSREHWRTEVRVLRQRVTELERQLGGQKIQPQRLGS